MITDAPFLFKDLVGSPHMSSASSPGPNDDPQLSAYTGDERWGKLDDAEAWMDQDFENRSGLLTIVSLQRMS